MRAQPGALESSFFNEVLEAAPWRVIMQEACGIEGARKHISIKDIQALMRTIRKRALRGYGCRQLYGLDSQVGLGALGKRRSPSYVLNEECREGLGDIIGLRHYPGYYFAPTRLNPGDHPSRYAAIPTRRALPGFFVDAARGNFEAFDRWASLPKQSRRTSNWARFAYRLLFPLSLVDWPWVMAR